MKNLLFPLRIYEVYPNNFNCELLHELSSYALALDKLQQDIENFRNNYFPLYSNEDGLIFFEDLLGIPHSSHIPHSIRCQRANHIFSVDHTYFTLSNIIAIFRYLGIDLLLNQHPSSQLVVADIFFYDDPLRTKQDIYNIIRAYIPSHLQVNVIFPELSFDDFDDNDLSFNQLDQIDFSWHYFDTQGKNLVDFLD